jgi:hypothetical protein
MRLLENKVVELNMSIAQGGSSNGSNGTLDRRIPDQQTLIHEIAAWEEDRNANHAKADWQFTTPEARIRHKHLYPSI